MCFRVFFSEIPIHMRYSQHITCLFYLNLTEVSILVAGRNRINQERNPLLLRLLRFRSHPVILLPSLTDENLPDGDSLHPRLRLNDFVPLLRYWVRRTIVALRMVIERRGNCEYELSFRGYYVNVRPDAYQLTIHNRSYYIMPMNPRRFGLFGFTRGIGMRIKVHFSVNGQRL
jgi:hypothetical protein